MMISRRAILAQISGVALVGAAMTGQAMALTLGSLARKGMLQVDGRIATGEIVIDRAFLEEVGTEILETTTPFTETSGTFRGVPLERLLTAVGARGSSVRATAVNDYSVGFDLKDAVDKGAFIAFEHDGEPMSVRGKGPYWIIFPWSQKPELDSRTVRALSIWQLVRLTVE